MLGSSLLQFTDMQLGLIPAYYRQPEHLTRSYWCLSITTDSFFHLQEISECLETVAFLSLCGVDFPGTSALYFSLAGTHFWKDLFCMYCLLLWVSCGIFHSFRTHICPEGLNHFVFSAFKWYTEAWSLKPDLFFILRRWLCFWLVWSSVSETYWLNNSSAGIQPYLEVLTFNCSASWFASKKLFSCQKKINNSLASLIKKNIILKKYDKIVKLWLKGTQFIFFLVPSLSEYILLFWYSPV